MRIKVVDGNIADTTLSPKLLIFIPALQRNIHINLTHLISEYELIYNGNVYERMEI